MSGGVFAGVDSLGAMGRPTAHERKIVLETDRLLLRPWRVSEAVILHQLWTERDPRVPPHRRIDAEGDPTVEDLEDRIRSGFHANALGLLAAERKASGDVIGYCGLTENSKVAEGEPELAFEFLRRVWGQGYATEASWAVLSWAQASGYRRLWATVSDWNVASRRVLAKLEFIETDRVEPGEGRGDVLFTVKQL
ncbi:MAG TPA: GNAT family N-acetyltransferase [Egicoccus sp.]|nr:GNAT family N-acetyltransferase [Egicoccus sp.]HSK25264.1 GNAT family N-acetyltransferase [Egicoccus sp.]